MWANTGRTNVQGQLAALDLRDDSPLLDSLVHPGLRPLRTTYEGDFGLPLGDIYFLPAGTFDTEATFEAGLAPHVVGNDVPPGKLDAALVQGAPTVGTAMPTTLHRSATGHVSGALASANAPDERCWSGKLRAVTCSRVTCVGLERSARGTVRSGVGTNEPTLLVFPRRVS